MYALRYVFPAASRRGIRMSRHWSDMFLMCPFLYAPSTQHLNEFDAAFGVGTSASRQLLASRCKKNVYFIVKKTKF